MYLVGLSRRVVLFLLLLLHCVRSIADDNLFGLGEANVSVQCKLVSLLSKFSEAIVHHFSDECKEIACWNFFTLNEICSFMHIGNPTTRIASKAYDTREMRVEFSYLGLSLTVVL